jgi:hypothetical protein
MATGMSFDDLVAALGRIEGLRDKGKRHPNFHLRSRPFLHFHSGPDGTHADVRFGDDFEAVPASTPEQRAALLARVSAHVEATHASRGTGRS